MKIITNLHTRLSQSSFRRILAGYCREGPMSFDQEPETARTGSLAEDSRAGRQATEEMFGRQSL